MNNLKINKDTIKKLMLIGLLTLGTGSLAGCSNSKKSDSNKQEHSFKLVSSKNESKDIETMTADETKMLLAGDEIDKVPDAKTLESMGLCYEIVYELTQLKGDKIIKTELKGIIEPEAYEVNETYDDSVIIDGENRHNIGKYQYVHIVPIDGVIIINGETTWYKEVTNLKGKQWVLEIKFEENIEILKAMFEVSSLEKTKTKTM